MATARGRLGYSHRESTAAKVWNILSAMMIVVLFASLIFLAYVLVRADGGPAIVRHEQVRKDGNSFMAWNFGRKGGLSEQ